MQNEEISPENHETATAADMPLEGTLMPDTDTDTQNTNDAESVSAEASSDLQPEEDFSKLLQDSRNKADEYWDQLVRTKAELENISRRHQRELENAHKYGLDKFVESLLGVRDSLELGHKAAQEESADINKIIEGTELTLKMLSDVMEKFGVSQVAPEGEPFNPELHQAMAMQPSEEYPPNTVITVIQKGYTLNGRLVRPALVLVSQAAS